MTLKLSELKKFKSAASYIKTGTILPVLGFIKFETGNITKTNLNSFVVYNVSYDGPTFLIEERILNTFIENCNAEEIEVSIAGGSIKLSADGMPSVKSESGDISAFPSINEPDGEVLFFDKDFFSKVQTASKFIVEDDITLAKAIVFIGNGLICGSDGFIAYCDKVELSLPKISLPKTTLTSLQKIDCAKFRQSESYHFFETDYARFGFVKPEYNWVDESIFFNIPEDATMFTVDKSKIISFNEIAASNLISKGTITLMSVDSLTRSLSLSMKDSSYNVEQDYSVPIEGGAEGSIGYNPILLNRLLKAIPDEKIIVHQVSGKYYITGAGTYKTLIMELVTQ